MEVFKRTALPLSALLSPEPSSSSSDLCILVALPPEIINLILNRLSPVELAAVSATCRKLREHAIADQLWKPLVQENVPGVVLTVPRPCASFMELYAAHDRVWFLPKYKIWFSDQDLMGKVMIALFDPRRGCIDGYQMVCSRTPISGVSTWIDPDDKVVSVTNFAPRVSLHRDKPIVYFPVQRPGGDEAFLREHFGKRLKANRFSDEMPMPLDERAQGIYRNFILTCPLNPALYQMQVKSGYPWPTVWPTPNIPARHHTHRQPKPAIRPTRRQDVSDQTFAIRHWMQTPITYHHADLTLTLRERVIPVRSAIEVDNYVTGDYEEDKVVYIGEAILTFSTLDPYIYTPTKRKPWRGIWVGEYSSHGPEFILIHQPDQFKIYPDEQLGIVRLDGETDEQWEKRRDEERSYVGSLEAIKLTGDPNVPRGERTFYVADLGRDGHAGYSEKEPFAGVRIVHCEGQLADTGYSRPRWRRTKLLLVSHDRLAVYWEDLSRVSYYVRVDIDSLLR